MLRASQVVPFAQRVALFHRMLAADKLQTQGEINWHANAVGVRIRRDHLFEDSYALLNVLGVRLKSRVQITFISEHGIEEAGIDGGGVFKEYMDTLTRASFDPDNGLFNVSTDQLLHPNPASALTSSEHLALFEVTNRAGTASSRRPNNPQPCAHPRARAVSGTRPWQGVVRVDPC